MKITLFDGRKTAPLLPESFLYIGFKALHEKSGAYSKNHILNLTDASFL